MAGRPRSRPPGSKRVLLLLVGAGVVGLVWYFFPPFRIVSLDEARAKRAQATFQPREFAETFWANDLQDALDDATAADELLALIRSDPRAAKEAHGRTAELGNVYYYFVRGAGLVTKVGDEEVSVALANDDGHSGADVVLVTANVFGNAIRNATGLLDVNQFGNSQDFNNLSHELNTIAEYRVLSPFQKTVTARAAVEFVGCAEIEDEDRDLDPLRIIPVHLEIRETLESGAGKR